MTFNRPETQTQIYKDWMKKVQLRCKYRCVVCNRKSGICHHLDGWNWAYSLRYEPKNGIVLCRTHHNQFHQFYGYKDNTKYQFDEYLRLYYNKKLDDIL